ncbi:MAG: hypothetical protein J6X18_08850 [Bacteroidales bacterium]|nr:hypothetical protein [Bacteroidales bacterium]
MAQTFHINKGATLPTLKMEVIDDGRNDFWKIYLGLQATYPGAVRFSMWNQDTGIYKIANAEADIIYDEDSGCEERYYIQYAWKPGDTDEAGIFNGLFTITFNDNFVAEGVTTRDGEKIYFPNGDLKVPIAEDLVVSISDSQKKI